MISKYVMIEGNAWMTINVSHLTEMRRMMIPRTASIDELHVRAAALLDLKPNEISMSLKPDAHLDPVKLAHKSLASCGIQNGSTIFVMLVKSLNPNENYLITINVSNLCESKQIKTFLYTTINQLRLTVALAFELDAKLIGLYFPNSLRIDTVDACNRSLEFMNITDGTHIFVLIPTKTTGHSNLNKFRDELFELSAERQNFHTKEENPTALPTEILTPNGSVEPPITTAVNGSPRVESAKPNHNHVFHLVFHLRKKK